MEYEFWNKKWVDNQIGFHLEKAHGSLEKHFPKLPGGARVLVPLCGKSYDLLWLAAQGYSVTGVEFIEQAILEFFEENAVPFTKQNTSDGLLYTATDRPLSLVAGDFFEFNQTGFDALYDRAALVALPEPQRSQYVRHCKSLLKAQARALMVVLEYPQEAMPGPPFSISKQMVKEYWGDNVKQLEKANLIGKDKLFKDIEVDYFNELSLVI